MKTTIEIMKLALEALEGIHPGNMTPMAEDAWNKSITALRQAIEQAEQAQPEFTTHAVENAYDWSEWVCPDPKGYLMKCCDCGLVHEVEFKVVRYKSEAEREDCEPVDDPNVQAVFRMRRSEQWSPVDTAHRAGGLPMEQAEQVQPCRYPNCDYPCMDLPDCKDNEQAQPVAIALNTGTKQGVKWLRNVEHGLPLYTAPPPRQPEQLTDEDLRQLADKHLFYQPEGYEVSGVFAFARAAIAKHGSNK
jgi:hypothetical protein